MSDNDLSGKKKWPSGKKNCALTTMSPSDNTELLVVKIEQKAQRKLAHKIEDRCFEISKRVLDDIPLNSFGQMNMALAILKFVRNEFGVSNRFQECDTFIKDVYKVADLDYSHETQLLKDKYQKFFNMNFNSRSNTTCENLSQKPKSTTKISNINLAKLPNQSVLGKKFESVYASAKSNSERSKMRLRQNSVILNDSNVNQESSNKFDYYKKNPSIINIIPTNVPSINTLTHDNIINSEVCSNANQRNNSRSKFEGSCGKNTSGTNYSSLNLEQQETVKTIKKLILNDSEDEDKKINVSSIDKPKKSTLNCRFNTYMKDLSCNDTINFNNIIKKPRLTVADLYLKPPQFSKTTHPIATVKNTL